MKTTNYLLVILGILLIFTSVSAQDLEEGVSSYTSANGKLYIQPLADVFGANLNSGWFHSARIKRWGFHMSFGLIAMAAPISESQRTFIAVPDAVWNPDPGTELPTIFGTTDPQYIPSLDDTVSGAFDAKWFPFAVPQLTIGNIFGTEFTLRYISLNIDDEIGTIKLFGWGVRHSISQYIPFLPVELSVGYFGQRFTIGEVIEALSFYTGVQASFHLGMLCFYSGIGYENASLDLNYEHELEDGTVQAIFFNLDSKNRYRLTAGILFDLPVVKIFFDYNLAAQQTFSAGIALGW